MAGSVIDKLQFQGSSSATATGGKTGDISSKFGDFIVTSGKSSSTQIPNLVWLAAAALIAAYLFHKHKGK